MSAKNDIEVIINGKVYTLSGSESEDYLQKVALYINNKINEFKKLDSYRYLNLEYQNILLALNIADDYFKAKDTIEELKLEIAEKDKQSYNIKHEVVETQIRYETSKSLEEEYKEKIKELQQKIIELENQ